VINLKAVGYIRVSKENDQGCSLKVQKQKIIDYCKFKDLELIKVYQDNGKSGKNLKRDGVQKVIKKVNSKKCSHVICFRLDRMFRSTLDLLNTLELFKKKGVSFHSIQESIDTKSAHGEFILTLLGSCAQLERRMVSERMLEISSYKRRHGLKQSGLIPYGFDVKNKKLIPNQAEQMVIGIVKDLRKQGMNLTKIARWLNDEGYSTKYGKKFFAQQIKNILLKEE
jgi:site-specific DNA recombinase